MKPNINIFKIGGNVINSKEQLNQFLDKFSAIKTPKVLIHGGGKLATELCNALHISTDMIEGRRVTCDKTIDVVTMVYAGLINKQLVCKLQALTCNAIGLTGADLNSISAVKRKHDSIDFGWVGDVVNVNSSEIIKIIQQGYTPVFSPITHNNSGQLLNTNADTVASEIAIALSKYYNVKLHYCFEKPGVLDNIDNDDSVILTINKKEYKTLKSDNKIHSGMIPKLDNCFYALKHNVKSIKIGNTISLFSSNHTLLTQ